MLPIAEGTEGLEAKSSSIFHRVNSSVRQRRLYKPDDRNAPAPKYFTFFTPISMATSKSGLDLIHALKASSDPPVPGGKPKIDIATEAWNDQSFYLPGKAELLGDFILTRFAKDKDNDS